MSGVWKGILDILPSLNVSKWGVCDITGLHPISAEFPTAVSLALKYPQISDIYTEIVLHEAILETKKKLNREVQKLEAELTNLQVAYKTVPEGQDPDTLLGYFPHKTAAVKAGMGWIGKNTLLVTEEYGPRVRLATVLLGIKPDREYVRALQSIDKCKDCSLCIQACPYGCLTGKPWHMGINRDEMLDAFRCSSIRESFIEKIGHKHNCGYCLLACPFGRQ